VDTSAGSRASTLALQLSARLKTEMRKFDMPTDATQALNFKRRLSVCVAACVTASHCGVWRQREVPR
jgi:hypothetical protein